MNRAGTGKNSHTYHSHGSAIQEAESQSCVIFVANWELVLLYTQNTSAQHLRTSIVGSNDASGQV